MTKTTRYVFLLDDVEATARHKQNMADAEEARLKKLRSVSEAYRKTKVLDLVREAAEWRHKADFEQARRDMNRHQMNNYYAALQNTPLAERCYPSPFDAGVFRGLSRLFSR